MFDGSGDWPRASRRLTGDREPPVGRSSGRIGYTDRCAAAWRGYTGEPSAVPFPDQTVPVAKCHPADDAGRPVARRVRRTLARTSGPYLFLDHRLRARCQDRELEYVMRPRLSRRQKQIGLRDRIGRTVDDMDALDEGGQEFRPVGHAQRLGAGLLIGRLARLLQFTLRDKRVVERGDAREEQSRESSDNRSDGAGPAPVDAAIADAGGRAGPGLHHDLVAEAQQLTHGRGRGRDAGLAGDGLGHDADPLGWVVRGFVCGRVFTAEVCRPTMVGSGACEYPHFSCDCAGRASAQEYANRVTQQARCFRRSLHPGGPGAGEESA